MLKGLFEVKFTARDLVRSIWTAVAVYVFLAVGDLLDLTKTLIESCQVACDWSTAKGQAVAIGIALGAAVVTAIKNLFLRDGTALKG